MSPSRVLVVGLGSIGRRHLRIARELLPAAEIRVLRHQECTTVPEHADGCISSMDQAIEFAPEIAVLANPATYHLGVAQPLAESGVHLLVEKPLSASIQDVSLLIETCRRRNAVLATGYNLRFLPSLQKFKALLDDKLIGRIWSARSEAGQYLPSWRPDADYRQGVSARKALGGGVLLELSHELDYLRWIFGEVDWVQAALSRQSNLEIDVEDTAQLVLGFLPSKIADRLIASVSLDFIRRDTTRTCTAIGEGGSLRWNGVTGTVELFAAGTTEWRLVFCHQATRDESYVAEWRDFLACVDRGSSPLAGGEDGQEALRIIDAARQASDTGSRVGLTTGPMVATAPVT